MVPHGKLIKECILEIRQKTEHYKNLCHHGQLCSRMIKTAAAFLNLIAISKGESLSENIHVRTRSGKVQRWKCDEGYRYNNLLLLLYFSPHFFCCFRWCVGSFIQYTQLLADDLQDQVQLDRNPLWNIWTCISYLKLSQQHVAFHWKKKVWIQDK